MKEAKSIGVMKTILEDLNFLTYHIIIGSVG